VRNRNIHRIVFSLLIVLNTFYISGQTDPIYPDLSLHGTVTWLDSFNIRVEYDWTDDAQLIDWMTTDGADLVRGSGVVTVEGGNTSVRAMIWKQGIRCSKIVAEGAVALTTDGHHLNFYSDLISFDGNNYLPDPGLGAVLADYKNFWAHNGTKTDNIGTPYIVVGVARDYELTFSTTGMTIKSSADNIVYSYIKELTPEKERKIALGGWGGDTRWGKITIEGEVSWPWQDEPVPSDIINIQSAGAVFAPVIEVSGTPLIEWIFDDSTTSNSAKPIKNYGTSASRHNYLRVTPWSALLGINVGYDEADGGYGEFDIIQSQNVIGFRNLNLAKNSLRYLCASYNPLAELDLSEMTALEFAELFTCQFLKRLKLGTHPELERLCVEKCDLDSLDISGCQNLEDFRGALNSYKSIKWGSTGQSLWHICIRDNPQMEQSLPDLTQFPVLKELFNWNSNQSGAFVIHSPTIRVIESAGNKYTNVDISNCRILRNINFTGSQLTSLNFGNGNYMKDVRLVDCGLTQTLVDYVLQVLDGAGHYYGILDLTGNEAPSSNGQAHISNLISRGWTVNVATGLKDPVDDQGILKIVQTQDEIKILLRDSFIGWQVGLYSLSGNRILSRLVDGNELILNVSDLAVGMYIMELSDGRQRHLKKVVIR
jgi:hypothetical protein